MTKITTGIACAILSAIAPAAAVVTATAASPAYAQDAGFTTIGAHALYRIDGLRDGVHKGANVRFLDMTLKNLAPETTFAATIQSVWWQGRSVGAEVKAVKRDGQPFGMHGQYITQGQVVAVSYPIPVRDDVSGVTIEYSKPGDGPKKRVFSWADLAAAAR
ncbi:MAG: hypothetical protein AB1942_22455 [Pseudomonadota bacterium]